jgi:hypothetical protein
VLDVERTPRADPAPPRQARPGGRRAVVGALVAAVVLAAVLAVNLSKTAPRLAGVDQTRLDAFSTALEPGATVCQPNETVPSDAGAVSLVVGLFGGNAQPLSVSVSDNEGVRRARISGPYGDGARVTAPLSGPRRASVGARLCIRNDGDARVAFGGIADAAQIVDRSAEVTGRIGVSWYRPGSESWWSVASAVAERGGRAKAGWVGMWTMWAMLAAVLATSVLAVATVAAARRRPARVAWACALVALVNATAWALLTPPFQVPDEHKHVAYAVNLGETGRPPTAADVQKGDPIDVIGGLQVTWFRSVVFDDRMRPPWTPADDALAERALEQPLSRRGGAEGATSYPPLYYAAAAAAAKIDDGGNVLDRMTLMRLASALFAAVAAFFAALFVRELVPSAPWAWAAGGMVAAYQPMLGFMGGGVNNDSLLFAATAALLYAVGRSLRNGLTPRLAALAGGAITIGVLTKPTMVALLPLVCLGLGLAAWRARRRGAGVPWRALALVVAVAVAPIAVYSAVNANVWDRGVSVSGAGALGSATTGNGGGTAPAPPQPTAPAPTTTRPWTLGEQLSYTWQFYLPRLPFMNDQFGDTWPLRRVWFKGWIGRFGWQDTEFSRNVYLAGLLLWAGALVLAAAALWRRRDALRRRWAEVVTYVAGALFVVAALHYVGYDYLLETGEGFEQARYLLVLLPLYAGFVALAAYGAGRRAGPYVAGALVVLAFGNALAGLLVTAARYYG